MPWLKISAAAKELGVSSNVLRDWDKAGKITTIRSPGGIRLFDISSVVPTTVAQSKRTPDCTVVLYTREGTEEDRDALDQQEDFIRDNLPNRYTGSQLMAISDIGSGLDFKRPGLLRVMELVKAGNVSGVVVASRERLTRIGFELIEWFCTQHGTAIVVLGEDDTCSEEEMCRELKEAVQVFFKRAGARRRRTAELAKAVPVSPDAELEPEPVVEPEPEPEPAPEVVVTAASAPVKKKGRKPKQGEAPKSAPP